MIDLKLDGNGDLAQAGFSLQWVNGAEQVGQRARIRLLTFLGEVAQDLDAGVPWMEEILAVKPVNIDSVEAILRQAILDDEEVKEIQKFSVAYVDRALSVTFTILSIYGPASGQISQEVG